MPLSEQPKPVLAQTNNALLDRRKLLQSHGIDLVDVTPGQLGIAFSGGGIRSATISLGVAQALARQDRLLDFDYMSTVSGGGYFGSFLRSLFLPQSARGSDAVPGQADCKRTDTNFALDVLKSEPNQTKIHIGTTKLTNPIRWLRENSRYLAPAGPTDYAVAATYIVRNWVAMLFVFALPTLLFFMLLHLSLHGLQDGLARSGFTGQQGGWTPANAGFTPSMLIAIPALLLLVSIVIGVANWLTIYTADLWAPEQNAAVKPDPAKRVLVTAACVFVAGVFLLLVIRQTWDGDNVNWLTTQWGGRHKLLLIGRAITPATILVLGAAVLAIGAMAAALITVAGIIWIERYEPKIGDALFGNELRRWLTNCNSIVNLVMVAMLALALVDTIALWLERTVQTPRGTLALSALVAAAGRWLIQKLGASFGKASPAGAIGAFLARYVWLVAFLAAVLLWGGFALVLDVMVREVAYAPSDWVQSGVLGLAIVTVLSVMVGWSDGFINLSSLHSLYAARLTRAYLGATNHDRLLVPDPRDSSIIPPKDVTQYQPRDVIKADVYQQQVCAAPLHLMNVTLNETVSATGSQLLERDRKGVPLVIAPEGIWIDAAAAAPARTAKSTAPTCSWAGFTASHAEPFSVGQITAISGAAASSAMGSRTTLGGALLFTYANIRLGYWWNRGGIENKPDRTLASPRDRLKWTGTFGYLLREMIASYRSTTGRVNLSDGGHFDNSGVYELLRRQTRTIVYSDNGEDIGYHFEDLEILVRKARLDIGVSVEVATPAQVVTMIGMGGAGLFLNGKVGDWRARARARDHTDPAFALLLLVHDAAGRRAGTIVLLKPSLFGSLPADVWGYAEQHPDFPHETTADQFFTEAQWESYRKLGFMMMQQLLAATPHKADLFRKLGEPARASVATNKGESE
jgi:hypothetical protein